jgi:hypothetical protein
MVLFGYDIGVFLGDGSIAAEYRWIVPLLKVKDLPF